MVGNLPNHLRLKHPTEKVQKPPEKKPLTKEEILGEKPPEDPETEVQEIPNYKQIYACSNCRAEVRKGEAECWNCGLGLNWEGLNDE
jgi:hypothetical protein